VGQKWLSSLRRYAVVIHSHWIRHFQERNGFLQIVKILLVAKLREVIADHYQPLILIPFIPFLNEGYMLVNS
jgi:hypothetical protein